MLKSQRLQIKAAELREKVYSLTETRENKPEYDELRAKLAETDGELAHALKEEAEDNDKHMAESNRSRLTGGTPESREMRQLARRGSVDRILRAAVRGWGISDGPEHEMQSHYDLDSNGRVSPSW